MMTSGEVAQMFMAQNSMFQGQNQWANQIGMAQMNTGLGGWGRPQGAVGGAGFPGMHGGGPQPFSYAPSSFSSAQYGTGNRFASGAMSATGGAAQLGLAGLGLAGGFGLLGRAGALVDPFSAFGAARGAGAAMGMGAMGSIGMGLAGAALPMAGMALASHAVGSFVHGGQQQGMIGSQLGNNFQFFNPASRTGSGFSRQDAQAIGDSIRQLSHVPEMMTSVEELTKLLPKLKQSGVMQGVKDATEFSHRFKEAVGTIKDLSKVLGTTMEEASEFFAQSRGAGFIGKGAQLRNVLNAQFTSGVTGMSMGQTMGLAQSGAQMATQVGTKRSLGATAVLNAAQRIGLSQREGKIREGQIEDITGLEGPEAVQAMAQREVQLMYGMSQNSSVGRLMMLGMAKFEKGKFSGMDEDIVKRMQEGTVSASELKARISRLSHDEKISLTRSQAGSMAMGMAGKVGLGEMYSMMGQLAGGKGQEAPELLLQRMGATEEEANYAKSMQGPSFGGEEQRTMAKFRTREASLRERTSPEAILRRIKTKIHAETFGAIEQAGSQMFTDIGKAYDEFIDDVVGRHIVTLSKEGAQNLRQAMSGGSKKELYDMFSAASGISGASTPQGQKAGLARRAFNGSIFGVFTQEGREQFKDQTREAFDLVSVWSGGERSAQGEANYVRGLLGDNSEDYRAALANGALGDYSSQLGGFLSKQAASIEGFYGMKESQKAEKMEAAVNETLRAGLGTSGVYGKLRALGAEGSGTDILSDAVSKGLDLTSILEEMGKTGGTVGDAAKLIRAGAGASKRGFKGSFAMGAVLAGQGEYEGRRSQINTAAMGGTDFSNQEAVSRAVRDAQGKLGGLLSTGSSVAVQDNPELGKLMGDLDNPDVIKALEYEDPEKRAAALNKLGYKVRASDMDAVDKIRGEITGAGASKQASIREAFSDLSRAKKAGDALVIRSQFRDTATELKQGLKESGLGGAGAKVLERMSSAYGRIGKGQFGSREESDAALNELDAANTAFAEMIRSTKDPEERARLVKASGAIGATTEKVISGFESMKGSKADVDKLRQMLGGGENADRIIQGLQIKQGAKLDEKAVSGLIHAGAGARISNLVAPEKASEVQGVEKETLNTLKNLDKTMSLVGTILAAKFGTPEDKQRAEHRAAAARENQSPPNTN